MLLQIACDSLVSSDFWRIINCSTYLLTYLLIVIGGWYLLHCGISCYCTYCSAVVLHGDRWPVLLCISRVNGYIASCLFRVRLFRVCLFRVHSVFAYSVAYSVFAYSVLFRVRLFRVRLFRVRLFRIRLSVFTYSVFAFSVFAYSVFV